MCHLMGFFTKNTEGGKNNSCNSWLPTNPISERILKIDL